MANADCEIAFEKAETEKIREFLRAGESALWFFEECFFKNNEMNGEPRLGFGCE